MSASFTAHPTAPTGWTTLTDANKYASGSCLRSVVAGSTVSFTVTGHSLYLVISRNQDGGPFTVTVDGATVVPDTCYTPYVIWDASQMPLMNRCLVAIARNLSDTSHTVVVTTVNTAAVYMDGIIAVTGTAPTPTAQRLAFLGDSITHGNGLSESTFSHPYTVPGSATPVMQGGLESSFAILSWRQVQRATGLPWDMQLQRVPGDATFGHDGSQVVYNNNILGNLYGGQWRLFNDILPLAPQALVLMFGINDILRYNATVAEVVNNFEQMLFLLEDSLMTSQMAVVVCTPSPVSSAGGLTSNVAGVVGGYGGYYTTNPNPFNAGAGGSILYGGDIDAFVQLPYALKTMLARHPWVQVGYVHEALRRNRTSIWPSGTGDGVHPNESGHAIIATVVAGALCARLSAMGNLQP